MIHAYVFTLNNYTDDDVAAYKASIGKCGVTYCIFGFEEAPSTGTPHLQGYLQCNHDMTARLNKALPCGAHKKALGSWQKNYDYCTKGGDHWEGGKADKDHKGAKANQGKRSDLLKVKKAIDEGATYKDICDKHFVEAAKFGRFIREQISMKTTNTELDLLRKELESVSLRVWQADVVDIVKSPIHPRHIHWIWEETGNVGKSFLTKYLKAFHNACILGAGKKADMAYLYTKNVSKTVIFDLARTTNPEEGKEHMLDGVYSLAEDLKNGLVTSFKYDSESVLTRGCHVIIFANFPPDKTKWSSDRYRIWYVSPVDITTAGETKEDFTLERDTD